MSNLIGKLAGQVLGGGSSQPSQGQSSGIVHKVTDAVTGQKHPQDMQNESTGPFNGTGEYYYPQQGSGAPLSNENYMAHGGAAGQYGPSGHDNGSYGRPWDSRGGYEATHAGYEGKPHEGGHERDSYGSPLEGHGRYETDRRQHRSEGYDTGHGGGFYGSRPGGHGGYDADRDGHQSGAYEAAYGGGHGGYEVNQDRHYRGH